jgi:hypothetical protein
MAMRIMLLSNTKIRRAQSGRESQWQSLCMNPTVEAADTLKIEEIVTSTRHNDRKLPQ